MPVIQSLTPRNTPGVYVSENTYGSVPTLLANHGNVYVLGSCTSTTIPVNTPTYIANFADFTAQAVSSPSSAAIEMFFNQRSGSGLYFIKVAPRQQATLTATTFSAGTIISITTLGATVSYTCITGDTAVTAIDKLGAIINSSLAGVVSFYKTPAGVQILRYNVGVTVTVSASVTLGTPATGGTPVVYDVADSINYSFVPELGQGYLCAPEFFQSFTAQVDRTALQLQMEALCADPRFYWVSVVDFGVSTVTSSLLVNAAITERQTFTSPRGNSWCIFPYLLNLNNVSVPSSLAYIGVALRRARTDGFAQPPAGTSYPVYGVTGTSVPINNSQQDQLNPQGINCIRVLPSKGVVVYGARTLSTSSFYLFAATRVILNVLAGTLRNSFDGVVFSLVDGQGVLYSRIKQTAANICERLRLGGALYGASPDEAYLVICDDTNNTAGALDSGIVNLDVIAKPSPTLEVLNITMSRASLATTLVEVEASGDTAPIAKK